jgi:hypothetical protein
MSGYELWHRRLGHCCNRKFKRYYSPLCWPGGSLLSKKFESHVKCSSCMIDKITLENLSKLKNLAEKPLWQVNMDSFSSSVQSIEGYNHAVVFVDCNSGLRWLYAAVVYGMKNKSDLPKIVKKLYSDNADLLQRHTLVVVMRNNAEKNKSQEILDFFESAGVKNYFSTSSSYEQWQNELAEAAVNQLMMLSRTMMVESGLGGRF